MCGRFTLIIELSELQQELGIRVEDVMLEWRPRFNVAPSQPVAVITDPNTRMLDFMLWGLVPSWAKDMSYASNLINARSETVHEKPSFRNAFKRRRCLVLADGFFEWQKKNSKSPSIPYYFHLVDKKPFAFAGLWELWEPPDGSQLLSCTIITCPANEIVSPIHPRMPVMLTGEGMWDWLKGTDPNELHGMLQPYPASLMKTYQVTRQINSPQVDEPGLLELVQD